jgi:hypothetical protein
MKLGVIVPYRDREEHLNIFRREFVAYLEQKSIEFELIIVEQYDDKPFNRGKLLNIGAIKAKKLECDYVVFHDVDMIPIDADYSFEFRPIHLATSFVKDETNEIETLHFDEYFGGVTIFPLDQFEKINGYSNEYWGWGFEDDDLLFRCKKFNLPLDKKTYGKSTLKVMNNFSFTGDAFISVPIQPLQNDTLFDWRKSQTILITFQPNNIFCDPSKKKDDFTVFSIPGYDTCISYTSDRRYKVETWTDSNQCISINSEPMDEQWVQIAFVLDVKKKQIKFYLNNKLIGIEKMPSFFKEYVTEEPNFYLGVGDPYRSKDKNFFTGLISGFAVFDKELEEREIEFLYENINSFSLLTNFKKYKSSEDLAVYYDFQHYKQNKILDISGKGRHGEITNAYFKQTKEVFGKTISLPHRRISKFRKLNHYNNGWERGGWIQEETRLNQIRFMNDVSNNMIDVREDGLNNCLYNLVKEETFNKNIHHLFARI